MTGPDKSWQARNDLSTLNEAAQIRKDKSRFKAAMNLIKETMKSENADMMAGVPSGVRKRKKS